MTGGIIQLVAYGQEDMYLSNNPQITFFKIVYRRHTNFSYEQIPQTFANQRVNFGRKITTTISKNGDLLGNSIVIITLPKIQQFQNSLTKFAWTRRIGFAIIKSVEIEINGHLIDKHYGEWLSLWAEMTGFMSGNKSVGFKKMIGDVPELYNFTSSKDEYTLYVPLQFWFCRSSGLMLPLVSLTYSDVKINIELNDASYCYKITPSHYIQCTSDLVNFIPNEYIQQTISPTDIRAGIFSNYDINTKRLYYYLISNDKLCSIPITNQNITDPSIVQSIYNNPINQKYLIQGITSKFQTFATLTSKSLLYIYSAIRNLNIVSCTLLLDFFFIDTDERYRFMQTKHDYLIEQLYVTPSVSLESINRNVKLYIDQPCKLLVWILQMQYIYDSNDFFNYTNSYIRNYDTGNVTGKNIAINETILFTGRERLSLRDSSYFNFIQPYQHIDNAIQIGINMYSTSLFPLLIQPTGTCNMSQIETVELQFQLSNSVNINTPAVCRSYALCYNVLRISNGICGIVFTQ
jgi:hypothetical protein